jgi:hypothetical protein
MIETAHWRAEAMNAASDTIGKEAAAVVARLVDAIDIADRDLRRLVKRSNAVTRDDFDSDVMDMIADICSALYAIGCLAGSLAAVPLSETPAAVERLMSIARGRPFEEAPAD